MISATVRPPTAKLRARLRRQIGQRLLSSSALVHAASASTNLKTCVLAAQIAIVASKKKIREVMLLLMSSAAADVVHQRGRVHCQHEVTCSLLPPCPLSYTPATHP